MIFKKTLGVLDMVFVNYVAIFDDIFISPFAITKEKSNIVILIRLLKYHHHSEWSGEHLFIVVLYSNWNLIAPIFFLFKNICLRIHPRRLDEIT